MRCPKRRGLEAVIKSAASAASTGFMEAVIKSAASAASLGFAGECQDHSPACGRPGMGRSPANPGEAALAADLITASSIRLLAVPGLYCEVMDGGKQPASKMRV